jgi:signal transduction histidine kinase
VRRRLLLSYLLLTLLVLVVLEVPLAVAYRDRARDQLTAGLERDAFVLAAFGEDAIQGNGAIDLQELATNYQDRTDGRVVIVDRDGISVADSDPLDTTTRSFGSRPEFQSALANEVATGTRHSTSLGTELLFVAVPITSGGEVYGAIRVSLSTAQVEARVHRYWFVLLGIGVVSLVAAGLVAEVVFRWVSRPLVALRDAAGRLGSGNLTTRAPTQDGPPEVRELAESFNTMAGRLDELVQAQRAFVADASHQLRTPLTALRLRLENLEQEISGDEAEADLDAARTETRRLSRLVDGLLTLARADRPTTSTSTSTGTVELGEVLTDRIASWRPVAEEFGLTLTGAVPHLTTRGDPDRLAQVIDNLIANAIDASSPDDELRLTARPSTDRQWIEVHVIDQGPGLTPEQRSRAFDRFWRADPSSGSGRSSGPSSASGRPTVEDDTRLGGTGLGLAIVRQLVRVDGGEVELAEADGGGIDAVVRLRPAPP